MLSDWRHVERYSGSTDDLARDGGPRRSARFCHQAERMAGTLLTRGMRIGGTVIISDLQGGETIGSAADTR